MVSASRTTMLGVAQGALVSASLRTPVAGYSGVAGSLRSYSPVVGW
jgi:hypothetical protein